MADHCPHALPYCVPVTIPATTAHDNISLFPLCICIMEVIKVEVGMRLPTHHIFFGRSNCGKIKWLVPALNSCFHLQYLVTSEEVTVHTHHQPSREKIIGKSIFCHVVYKMLIINYIFRLHLWSGGDWRNRFCSFYQRGFLWMEGIWTETQHLWRQPTHRHGRVQNQHQSKPVWAI